MFETVLNVENSREEIKIGEEPIRRETGKERRQGHMAVSLFF